MKKKEGSEEDDRQKESRQEKDKGGKQEKGETCRSNGQPRSNDDGSHISVARSQRETRAEPSGCVAVPHGLPAVTDRKSTRLNSSHLVISYAVFCLKKKKIFTRLACTEIY